MNIPAVKRRFQRTFRCHGVCKDIVNTCPKGPHFLLCTHGFNKDAISRTRQMISTKAKIKAGGILHTCVCAFSTSSLGRWFLQFILQRTKHFAVSNAIDHRLGKNQWLSSAFLLLCSKRTCDENDFYKSARLKQQKKTQPQCRSGRSVDANNRKPDLCDGACLQRTCITSTNQVSLDKNFPHPTI